MEISKYFRKVNLQISIRDYLSEKNNGVASDEELRKLSMFGSSKTKEKIAERLIFLGNNDLGFRVMQEFRLPQGEIYSNAVKEMVLNKRKKEMANLLKTIKGMIDSDEWDTVLLSIVKTYAVDLNDKSNGEKYISKIFNPRSQVKAYTVVGLLKTAFVLAAKSGWVDEVGEIRAQALTSGSKTVVQLCNSYLAKASTK